MKKQWHDVRILQRIGNNVLTFRSSESITNIYEKQKQNLLYSNCDNNQSKSFFSNISTSYLISHLLPKGYPHSVSKDYLSYQIWDTIQAFASSISGSLATQVSISF